MYEIKRAKKRHWGRIKALIAENPDTLEQKYLPKRKEFFVALGARPEEGGRRPVVGCVALEGHHKQRLVELRSLAVDEAERGNGLGRALIEHALLGARKRKVKQVLTITRSPDMFRQFGFDFFRADEKYALINDLPAETDDRSA